MPHHDLFAERGRHRRNPQLDFLAFRRDGLDAPVLRAPALDDLHPGEQLDPAHHRQHHRRRNLVRLVQHAVDPEADDAVFAARLEVDVARALFERVLPEPVDDVDDVPVVRIERSLCPSSTSCSKFVVSERSSTCGSAARRTDFARL